MIEPSFLPAQCESCRYHDDGYFRRIAWPCERHRRDFLDQMVPFLCIAAVFLPMLLFVIAMAVASPR